MIILTIRTDKPEAEIGIYNNQQQIAHEIWLAHRELAETIHVKIKTLLESKHKRLQDIGGIVVYKGPGSFTGLRIGITVANTLANSLNVPIIGAMDSSWVQTGVEQLGNGKNDGLVAPEYGALPNISRPKH